MNNKFLLLVALLFYSSQAMDYDDDYYSEVLTEYTPIKIKIILTKRLALKNKTVKLSLRDRVTVTGLLEHAVYLKYGNKKSPQDFSLLPYNTKCDTPCAYEPNHNVNYVDIRSITSYYKTTTFLLQEN